MKPFKWGTGTNVSLISIKLLGVFLVKLKIAMFGGMFIAFPLIATQIYRFMAPGLYKHERQALAPYLVATPVFFIHGRPVSFISSCCPSPSHFFYNLAGSVGTVEGGGKNLVELMPDVEAYLDFVMMLILAFGLTFQLPVILTLLGQMGVVSAQQLQKWPPLCHCRRLRSSCRHHPTRPDFHAGHGGATGPALRTGRDRGINPRKASCCGRCGKRVGQQGRCKTRLSKGSGLTIEGQILFHSGSIPMHDIKAIRDNPPAFDTGLARRGLPPQSAQLIAVDEERRALIQKLQDGQSRRNDLSKEVGEAMKTGDKAKAEAIKAEVAALKESITAGEESDRQLTAETERSAGRHSQYPA